ANVTALAIGPNGHLYAGSDPNGIVYDISAQSTGTVLYDSTLPEIRAIAVDSIGTVYIAAMGGAVATRTTTGTGASAGAAGPVVASTPTVITVTEQAGMKVTPDAARTGTSTSSAPATSNTAVVEVSGVEKSAIYRIATNHAVETLRSSKEDNVFDLIVDHGAVLFSTDDHGRIYRLAGVGMHKTALIAEPGDGETTRLIETKSGLYAGLSNPARIVAFGAEASEPASYESQVHDSTSVARWGHLQWHGTGSGIVFRTRTGNAARPDGTWSAWSAPISNPEQALIQSPPARFIQWRAEWPAGNQAEINTVSVPYLSQNSPPAIHSITVTSVTGTNTAKAAANASTSTAAYSVTVTDSGEPPSTTTSTTSTQNVSRLQTTQTQISWQADDPDGDKLVYTVYFRAEDEQEWQLIRSRMFENTLLLDPDVFADGRYFFKVMASDSPSNSYDYALETEMVSTPVLIDNTPPLVTLGTPARNGMVVELDVDAADKTSPLRLCEYSLDAGLWQPVESVDGVTDSPHERFHLKLENVRPGEHLLVVRVYDSANNAGLARVVLR
ncbi:MAG: fibronectin type III domain-containing protein, partial [Acidobacteriaceae bacterium]|nr:fibronectin type III domain-containing protein [Acidobacteriaceae bacterium]